MNTLEFTLALGLGSLVAGFLGALTGLGGGVVIIPLLVLGFGVDIHYAIGASLVSVIATSSGAAAAYVREGYSNIRAGMFLEIATTIGALSGAVIATRVPANGLAIVFGIVCFSRPICPGTGPITRARIVRRIDGRPSCAWTPHTRPTMALRRIAFSTCLPDSV
jgi:Sulfite exporter TauE/SafE